MAPGARREIVRKLFAAPLDLAREVEKYRFRREHKTETAAILALVRLGLEADARRKPPTGKAA